MPAETRNDLGGGETAQLPVVRDAHLEESEFIEFSNNLLEPKKRASVLRHLDSCPRCREVLTELHRDDGHGSTKLNDPLLGQMLGEYRGFRMRSTPCRRNRARRRRTAARRHLRG